MALTLYKFGPRWGIDDPSPFCLKLESYLKLAGIDYKAPEFSIADMKKAPKGKYPYVVFENGKALGDSNLIIDTLVKEGALDLDKSLSPEQKAISLAFRRLIDENLYWVGIYTRWKDDIGWAYIKEVFFTAAPALMRNFIAGKAQKDIWNRAIGHGIGRHQVEEIYKIGEKDMQALSDYLGEKDFFFGGKKPTLLDVCVYAMIANFIKPPLDNPAKSFALSKDNLVAHTERMHEILQK